MGTRIKKQDLVVFRLTFRSTFFLIPSLSCHCFLLNLFLNPFSFDPVVNARTTLTLIATVPFSVSVSVVRGIHFLSPNPSFGSSLNLFPSPFDSSLPLVCFFPSILDHYFQLCSLGEICRYVEMFDRM